MNRQFSFLAILLASFFWPACKSEAPKTETQAQLTPPSLAPTTPDPTRTPEVVRAAPANFKKTFVGTIGDNLAVQMDIERDGNKIRGNYFYDKAGAYNLADKLLNLNGEVDRDGSVILNESRYEHETGKEKPTGTFKGKLVAVTTNDVPTLQLTGTWTGVRANNPLAVNLKELSFDLGGLKLTDKQSKDGSKKVKYEIESKLPQLTGDDAAKVEKFNNTIANFVAKHTGEFKKMAADLTKDDVQAAKVETAPPGSKSGNKRESPSPTSPDQPYTMEISYIVTAANKDFISILFSFYEYTGGAHPNTTSASFNYDFNRNEALKLADLFTAKSNYLKLVSDYCIKELKKLKTVSSAEDGASAKLENFTSWNIAPSGLRITFDRYQVAAYAAGDHEVVVPYSILKPLIKPDGVLAPYAK